MFPTETLVGDNSQRLCWVPIPNHWLSVDTHPTPEDVVKAMRQMYPQANRPDLWQQYPKAFGAEVIGA